MMTFGSAPTGGNQAPPPPPPAGQPPFAPAPFAPPPGPGGGPAGAAGAASPEEERRRRRRRLLLLLLIGALGGLLLLLSWFGLRYFLTHEPLPLPNIVATNTVPVYRYSLYDVDAPVGVAVTPSGDRIYVAESAGDLELKVLDADGNIIAAGVPPESQPSNRVPVYIARDPLTGELYVTDRLRGEIHIYDSDGTYARAYTPPAEIEDWQPLGVAFDEEGLLYVTDVDGPDHHRILVIDRSGVLLRTVTTRSGLTFPNAIAVVGDELYATDSNNSQLVRAQAGGTTAVPVVGPGVGPGGLALPRGLTADSQGRLYIADTTAHTVLVFEVPTERGARPELLGTFGTQGREDGQFNYPNGIAADDRGNFYVADQANNRIQVWSY